MPTDGTDTSPARGGRQGRAIPMVRPNGTADTTNTAGGRGVLASSLDLVFSYSRSQAFFGENLPSSPSFVARYRRPGDEEGGDNSLAPTEDEDESAEYSDEGDSEGDDEVDDRISLADSLSPERGAADGGGAANGVDSAGEALPANARVRFNKKRTRRRSSRHQHPRPNLTPGARQPDRPPSSTSYYADDNEEATKSSPHERSRLLNRQKASPNKSSGKPKSYTSGYGSGDNVPLPRPSQKLLQNGGGSPPFGDPMPDSPPFASSSGISMRLGVGPIGTSTFGQTLFNSFNVLCGVALLSEPLAFASAGWLGGTLLLLFAGLATNYTAKALGRIMLEDRSLMTYNDICNKAFGPSSRWLISFLFCIELMALSIALIIIFGDSLATLFPSHSSHFYKLVGFFMILPTVFAPYRILSYTSLIGILSSLTLVLVVIVDGVGKPEAPGSLRDPMETSWKPNPKWGLSAGLVMSGFAGHSVMPSLARDMQRPQDFNRAVNIAYVLAGTLYATIAVVGYLMFGNSVADEITYDLLKTPGFPASLNKVAVWMVAINPVAKFGISTRPLNETIEHILGLAPAILPPSRRRPSRSSFSTHRPGNLSAAGGNFSTTPKMLRRSSSGLSGADRAGESSFSRISAVLREKESWKALMRVILRVLLTAFLVFLAVVIPDFDRIMNFLGAFSAFVICVIIPVLAYLSVFKGRLSKTEIVLDGLLMLIGIGFAGLGTVFTFLPQKSNAV